MNRQASIALLLAGLAGLAGAAARAAAPAPNPVYGDELARCVVALRAEARAAGAASVRHTVTGLEVRGLWREFTIESAFAAPGGDSLGSAVSRCRTERWGPATALEVLTRSPHGPAPADARVAARPAPAGG
jgi:hypothetical protein